MTRTYREAIIWEIKKHFLNTDQSNGFEVTAKERKNKRKRLSLSGFPKELSSTPVLVLNTFHAEFCSLCGEDWVLRCQELGPPCPLFLHLDMSRLVLWGLHPWKGCLETDGHISAVGQVLEVVGSLSPHPLPSLPLFFFSFPHPFTPSLPSWV